MKQANKIFTYEEVAAVLGISRTTIYNWQQLELLPSGDYDIEKLEQAVDSIVELEKKRLDTKIRRMKSLLNHYKTELE